MKKSTLKTMEEKLKMVRSMHNIIVHINDENAYATWIYQMPDDPQEEDFEWFADPDNEESFNDLTKLFLNLCKEYLDSGLFIDNILYSTDST